VSFARRIELVAFLAGAGTLATEIAASRLLAPYFGSSTVVWANIIGLTLAYLAVGYWLGGRLADRRPEPRLLARILLLAAAALAITPFVARPILDVAVRGLDALSVGARSSSRSHSSPCRSRRSAPSRRSRSASRSSESPTRARWPAACTRSRPSAA
jgi:MFS family permease